MITASVVPAVGGNYRGKIPLPYLSIAFNAEPASPLIPQKVTDDTCIEAHGAGNPAAVDKSVIICNIRIDAETCNIDTVSVIDPDKIPVKDRTDLPYAAKTTADMLVEIQNGAYDAGTNTLYAEGVFAAAQE